VAAAAFSGHYEGSVPFIFDTNVIFPGDGTMNFDQNGKVAHTEINRPTEETSETATAITFPNTGTTGDCMGDARRKQRKDMTQLRRSDALTQNIKLLRKEQVRGGRLERVMII
jgi:hypothetical protein